MGMVHGVGPRPCDLMMVGEGSGFAEERSGRPLSGKVSGELDRYLDGVELPGKQDWFFTHLYRLFQGKDYVWGAVDLDRDEPFLLDELAQVKPKLIVTLGRPASRYFLGDVDLDSVQGIPFYLPQTEKLSFLAPETIILGIVHPAAGLRNPEMSPHVVDGFNQLAMYLRGEIEPRRLFDDPYAGKEHYVEITTENQLHEALALLQPGMSVAEDSEGWAWHPWSLQFSYQPGTAYLIRAVRQDLLHAYDRYTTTLGVRLAFHSALHDLSVRRAMGIPWHGEFHDTMVASYLLQLTPQGLKQSCLRYCGMQMNSFDDVMGDTSDALVRDYLTWLWDVENTDYEDACHDELIRLQTTPYTDTKGKVHAGRRVTKPPTLPKSPLHKAVTRVIQSKHPRKLWLDQVEDIQVEGYRRLGPIPEATLDYVAPERAIAYGCRDADGTTRLLPEYSRRIDALGLRSVYELELSTYPLIDRMQHIGLKPDLDHFAALSQKLGGEIDRLRGGLGEATGRDTFNANSGDQVADYLFGTLGLQEMKLTRSGRGSTNDKILEALEHEHPEWPVIATIREYREVYKLKNTFVDRLPDFVNRWPHDGRIHTTFRTTRVVTGRLSSSDPNVLAQPEHGKFATEFKRGWVADTGHVLCQWDESQVELRGLAHLSRDPVMCAVFRGEKRNPDGSMIDLHAALAERIFGVKPALQDKHRHRLPAKSVNFGIVNGMTNRGLSVELRKNGVDADEDTAQRWIDATLDLYKEVKRYMDMRIEEARQHGFIRCLSGRIRYIGGIRSTDDRTREEAERFAFSTPIQESATLIMKQAEAIVYNDILVPYWKQGRWVEPLLQVHDCLKMECEEGMEQELHVKMSQAMTQVPKPFCVPLAVEGEFGLNMADMVRFE